MNDARTDNSENIEQMGYKRVDLNTRMLAAVVDLSLIMLLLWPLLMAFSDAMNGPFNEEGFVYSFSAFPHMGEVFARLRENGIVERYVFDSVLQIMCAAAIIIPFWVKVGATPGKYLFRIRVVDAKTLQLLSWKHAAVRFISYVFCLLTLGIGIAWVGLSKKRLAVHDVISSTRLIILPKGQKNPF